MKTSTRWAFSYGWDRGSSVLLNVLQSTSSALSVGELLHPVLLLNAPAGPPEASRTPSCLDSGGLFTSMHRFGPK
jgi:hypothetical protein